MWKTVNGDQNDDNRLKDDCWKKLRIQKQYEHLHPQFLERLQDFANIWNEHWGYSTIPKTHRNIGDDSNGSVRSAPY